MNSDEKRAEELLKKLDRLHSQLELVNNTSDATLAAIIQDSADGILVVDATGLFLFANPAARKILGRNDEQLREMYFGMLPTEGDPLEIDTLTPDGRVVPVEFWARQTTWEGNPAVRVSLRDLTEQKQAERELIKAKQAAESANKVKSEFLANMSHEIRTPLNGITGMLQLLQLTSIDKEQEELVTFALKSSTRLTSLLTDILDLSRVEAGKMPIYSEPFDLYAAIESTVQLFLPVAQQNGIELQFYIDRSIPQVVCGDSTRLQQILSNLIGNATKFTREGNILVEVYPLPADSEADDKMLFSVSDTGIGIPDDKIDSLFEPFTQAADGYTRQFQGAGLGLAITKQLVALLGGHISIASEVNMGTTIFFCLPFKKASTDVDTAIQKAIENPVVFFSVLVAENDKVNQLAAVKMLEKKGHRVRAVEDGQKALEALQQNAYDVILMDIEMPVMDGMEATKRIRNGEAGNDKKDTPIIAMTAYSMAGDREKFLQADMDAYIAKPVAWGDLDTTFAQILKQKE